MPTETVSGTAERDPLAEVAGTLDLRDGVPGGMQWVAATFGATTVVAIQPDTGRIEARWLDRSAIDNVTRWAVAKNQAGWNLYFVVNLPTTGLAKKPAKSEITVIRAAAFADVDAKNGRSLDQARDVVLTLPPPSVIIASGGGFQPIWLLQEPVPITPETVARAEALSSRIAEKVGGDAVQNVDRILRLPFSINHPDEKKRAYGRVACQSGLLLPVQVAASAAGQMMPRYTFDALASALDACGTPAAPAASRAARASVGGNVVALKPGKMPTAFAGLAVPDMNAAAHANLPRHGFEAMAAERQNAMLAALLAHPEISKRADSPRADWLQIIFSLCHAETLGAASARNLALQWSKQSPRFNSDADFDKDWHSYNPGRTGGVTVATLIGLARDAGFDTAAWFSDARQDIAQQALATPGPLDRRPPSWATVPPIMTAATAGAILNKLLGFARDFGNGPSYCKRQPSGTVCPISPAELGILLAPYKINVGTPAEPKLIPAATWWTTWHGRHTVDTVCYDPEGVRVSAGELVENTWQGFAVQPTRGTWRRIAQHLIYAICNGRKTYWKYLVRWMAFAVQRPGTAPGVMLVLRSDMEGVGKSTVSQLLLKIFGPHGHLANSLGEVFGQFNEVLANKSFVALEESSFPGDHRGAAAIRATITGTHLTINPKGRRAYTVPNMLHLILTTNASWAVPAGAEARRFFVLDVTRREGRAYFDALYSEINSGGVAAMLHDLLAVDLSRFDPRAVPVTAALVQQQRLSADPITRWVMDGVVTQALIPGLTQNGKPVPGGGFGQTVPGSALYAAFLDWARTQGIRHPMSAVGFGRALTQLGMTRGSSNNGVRWAVPDAATLLAAAERRAGIRQVT
jgi:hypothetical protein